MSNIHLLLIHPESSTLALLRSMLYKAGTRIDEAPTDREALRMLERNGADLVIEGVDPQDPEALELLQYVRRKHPQVPVLLLFSAPNPERARDALQRGAAGVLKFPLPANELRAAVGQALERPWEATRVGTPIGAPLTVAAPLANGNGHAPAAPPVLERPGAEAMLGHDPALRHAIELALAIAPMRTPILIQGEAGTGKSLLSRLIHQHGTRVEGPFVKVSCADLKPAQLERELFGQGGQTERPGKLAAAQSGTLLLDPVDALTPETQLKLVRAIRDQAYEPVDSEQTCRADVRFILATAEDLAHLAAKGGLVQDLFDGISSVCLKLPPLRQRGADIELLAQHFRQRFARELGKEVVGFMPDALSALRQHTWPGNVRELESTVERSVVFCRGPKITLAHLALSPAGPRGMRVRIGANRPHLPTGIRPLKEALEEPEKQIILQALEALNWNRQETARVLDINRTTLYKKMKKYGLLDFEAPCAM